MAGKKRARPSAETKARAPAAGSKAQAPQTEQDTPKRRKTDAADTASDPPQAVPWHIAAIDAGQWGIQSSTLDSLALVRSPAFTAWNGNPATWTSCEVVLTALRCLPPVVRKQVRHIRLAESCLRSDVNERCERLQELGEWMIKEFSLKSVILPLPEANHTNVFTWSLHRQCIEAFKRNQLREVRLDLDCEDYWNNSYLKEMIAPMLIGDLTSARTDCRHAAAKATKHIPWNKTFFQTFCDVVDRTEWLAQGFYLEHSDKMITVHRDDQDRCRRRCETALTWWRDNCANCIAVGGQAADHGMADCPHGGQVVADGLVADMLRSIPRGDETLPCACFAASSAAPEPTGRWMSCKTRAKLLGIVAVMHKNAPELFWPLLFRGSNRATDMSSTAFGVWNSSHAFFTSKTQRAPQGTATNIAILFLFITFASQEYMQLQQIIKQEPS